MSELIVIVLLCGAGTFFLRLLPIWRARRKAGTAAAHGLLQSFLRGIGPAAITALLVVSLWPMIGGQDGLIRTAAIAAALLVIVAVKRLKGGIAGPTLAGAAVYGLLMHFLIA